MDQFCRTVTQVATLLVTIAAATAADDPRAALRSPDDKLLLTLHGVGSQVYACRPDAAGALAWTFQAPEAALLKDGTTVGRHGAGPFWAYQDGSRITAKVVAKADGAKPDSIPWLRLAVTGHEGGGIFGAVDIVLRLNTEGGTLQGPCEQAGALKNVPYEADYLFLAKS